MIRTEGLTIREVHRDLKKALGNLIDEQFTIAENVIKDRKWNSIYSKHVACYVVAEELPEWIAADTPRAHYVHVDMVYKDNVHELMFIWKTKKGLEHAYTVAARCAKELGV
jgi:hypothetical protein